MIVLILMSFINLFSIAFGSGNRLMIIYHKLSDEEKECYDITKVKAVQIIYLISVIILAILALIFKELYPDFFDINIFAICFIIEIVILLIMNYTKLFLNMLCKKRS